MSEPFSSSTFRVEQPRRGPFARSQYRVMDGDGTLLALADQIGERARSERLRTYFPGKSELHARAVLLVTPEDETPLLVVDKEEGRMRTTVARPDGGLVGTFRTERVGRRYVLLDGDDKTIGDITVDLARNNFTVKDTEGRRVGHVRKKWAGIATHLLTTADKYTVEIDDPVPEPLRTLVVTTAIAMDMFLHESKDIT
ncbi:phospholipid scramblase-related protein [Spirillospora sp. NPDC029432]|uniref:phospholipid scramblase-related protein n=1 Tax=Spirillospora sp. NPDC029432 TaxID=3154599 RepID=UPI0034541334